MATVGSKESVESNRSSITMIAALFGEEAAVRSKTVTTATTTVTATATPAWELFVGLPDWSQREAVVQLLMSANSEKNTGTTFAFHHFKEQYRAAMSGIIADTFYTTLVENWALQYAKNGEINVPFLDPGALSALAAYAVSVGKALEYQYINASTIYSSYSICR